MVSLTTAGIKIGDVKNLPMPEYMLISHNFCVKMTNLHGHRHCIYVDFYSK